MTSDERKRGLRQAVSAKMAGRTLYSVSAEIRLMWEIIDSLVDECAVLDEFMQDIEAVGAKKVGHEWPDLLITYNKARMAREKGL